MSGSMLHGRRQLLKSMFVSGAMSLLAQAPARRTGQNQPAGIKLAHRLNATSITDDDLLFLQQIGLTWVRLEFPEAELSFDDLRPHSNVLPGSVCVSSPWYTRPIVRFASNWGSRGGTRISRYIIVFCEIWVDSKSR